MEVQSTRPKIDRAYVTLPQSLPAGEWAQPHDYGDKRIKVLLKKKKKKKKLLLKGNFKQLTVCSEFHKIHLKNVETLTRN